MGIGDDIWGDNEQPGQQYDYIPNPYLEQATNNNKKKYTTLLITAIIIVALMVSGGIFGIIWAFTDYKDGILLRPSVPKEPVDVVDYDENNVGDYDIEEQQPIYADRNVNQYLLRLDEYIPLCMKVKSVEFDAGQYNDETMLTLEITNTSKYDGVEVVLRADSSEDSRIYISEYNDYAYSVYVDSGETKTVQYSIFSFADSAGDKIDFRSRGYVNLDLTIYCNEEVDWGTGDYNYLQLENGSISWSTNGAIAEVNEFDTWGYCSSYEIKEGEHIKSYN